MLLLVARLDVCMIRAYIMAGYSPRHLPFLARRNVPIRAGPPTHLSRLSQGHTPLLTSHYGSTVHMYCRPR
jgi:hypothetical protein